MKGTGMESPSKHPTKSRLAGKVAITLNKTLPAKLIQNRVNEISHLPYREETAFHKEVQDIHPLCKHALNCKLGPCVSTIVRKQRMRGFCDLDLNLGIPSHFYLQLTAT